MKSRCSACNAPKAHPYQTDDPMLHMLGCVWLCDSCVGPERVRERIDRERENRNGELETL